MNPNATDRRPSRLERECQVSSAPALLLGVASAVLAIVLSASALNDATAPVQAGTPTQQTLPSAA